MAAPKTLDGKIVLQAYMLDNSYKTLLVEPSSTVHDVCRRRECPPPIQRAVCGPALLPSSPASSHTQHTLPRNALPPRRRRRRRRRRCFTHCAARCSG
jgi:hypothetical protein